MKAQIFSGLFKNLFKNNLNKLYVGTSSRCKKCEKEIKRKKTSEKQKNDKKEWNKIIAENHTRIDDLRTCVKCKEIKNLKNDFMKSTRNKNEKGHICKKCYYKKNRTFWRLFRQKLTSSLKRVTGGHVSTKA